MKTDHSLPLWALIDQAAISATRFLIAVMVGKYGSEAELGLYSAGFGILVAMITVQESLVTTPYTFFSSQLDQLKRNTFAGSALTTVLAYLGSVTVLMAGVLAGLWILEVRGDFLAILMALVLITPTALLREFCRRWLFAHLRIRMATLLDILFSAVTLIGMVILIVLDQTTAFFALLITGLSSLVVVLLAFQFRDEFKFQKSEVRRDISKKFSFGKWAAGASLLSALLVYFAHWFLMATQGEAAAGLYAACLTLVLLANPFLLGLSSILAPLAARAVAEQGRPALLRLVCRYLFKVVGILLVFAGVLAFSGDWLLGVVFDPSYQGNQYTINILAIALIGIGVNFILANGLYALGQPRHDLFAAAIGLGVTGFLAWITQPENPGQMANCFVSGVLIMAVYRIVVFFVLASRPEPTHET